MIKKNIYKYMKIINLICSLIATYVILLNYSNIYSKPISDLTSHLTVSPVISLFVLFGIYTLLDKFVKDENKTTIMQKVLSILLSVMMITGISFAKLNSFKLLTSNFTMICIAMISFIGYYILFNMLMSMINNILKKINVEKTKNVNNKLFRLFDEKPFIMSFVFISLSWIIYLVAFYPGRLTPDGSYQLLQSLNIRTSYSDELILLDENVNITNHHSVVHTVLIGTCFRLGRKLINENFGIFLSTLLQFLVLISVLAYTIKYLKEVNISLEVRMIVLLIYLLVPMYAFYSITITKDVIYSALMILYIIQLYDFVKNYKEKKVPIKHLIVIFIEMLLISLFRQNGIYVVMLSFLFAVFYSRLNCKKMTILLILIVLANYSYINIILPKFKISNTSIREALSVPFQQTARYVRDYGNDLNDEEIKVIDNILEYGTLAQRYNGNNADAVKNRFNKYTTKDNLKDYFKIWMKCFIKRPNVYIESFINNTYGYYYPTNDQWYIYFTKNNTVNRRANINYTYNKLSAVRTILAIYGNGFRSIPGIGLISNIGFNTYLILGMVVYLLEKKELRKYIIVLLPHLLSIGVCLLSPVNNYFRYAMPYIFAMPITIVLFIKIYNEGRKNE